MYIVRYFQILLMISGTEISDLDLRIVLDSFLHSLGRRKGTINFEEFLDLYRLVLQHERMRRKWELRLNMLLEAVRMCPY